MKFFEKKSFGKKKFRLRYWYRNQYLRPKFGANAKFRSDTTSNLIWIVLYVSFFDTPKKLIRFWLWLNTYKDSALNWKNHCCKINYLLILIRSILNISLLILIIWWIVIYLPLICTWNCFSWSVLSSGQCIVPFLQIKVVKILGTL